MRIAFYNVTASFISGGLETYCWEVGRALAHRGHEVTIVAGNLGRARNNDVALVQFPFRIEQSWPNFGTRFRRLMERLSFANAGGLSHLIDSRYDAVVINKPFDFPVLWRAKRRGMRSATLFRSGGTDFFLGDRLFSKAVDYWVSTSLYNAAQVEARYGRPVKVIHNGVDVGRFCADAARRHPEVQTIVSVGRLVGWKGLHVIIEALAQLPDMVHYRAIGEGPEQSALSQLATRLGVRDRVEFTGRIDHAQLPELLATADVFVQPSIGEEAFGISVVEAMACGLPVLASDNGGMREIVSPGATGKLLPAGDVPAWAAALSSLLSDTLLSQSLGRAARQRAVDHFTWAANAEAVEAMLIDS